MSAELLLKQALPMLQSLIQAGLIWPARKKRSGVLIQNFEYPRRRIPEHGCDFESA